MGLLFNEYSFLILSLAAVLMAAVILLTRHPKWNDILAFAVIAAGLFTAWIILHPRQTPLMVDSQNVRNMIGAGTPVLLEFQSPFCISCTAIKPVVEGLENELGNRVHIIRLNVQENVGRELGAVYGFTFTPTFIFFDAQGTESWRQIGTLDSQRVRDSIP
jgi:thioredoxin 1